MTKHMKLTYEETGEVRPPKAGEWFKTPQGGEKLARFDFSGQSFPILTEKFGPAEEPNAA
jgi:hypothetical protein